MVISRDLAKLIKRGWLCFNMFYILHAPFLLNSIGWYGIIYLYVLNRSRSQSFSCRCFEKSIDEKLLSQGTNANSGMSCIAWNVTFQLDSPHHAPCCTVCPGWKLFDRWHFSQKKQVLIYSIHLWKHDPIKTAPVHKATDTAKFCVAKRLAAPWPCLPRSGGLEDAFVPFPWKEKQFETATVYWPYI